MFTTIVFAGLFLGQLVASVMLWTWFLRLGLRWASVSDVTVRRVVVAAVVLPILNVTLLFAFSYIAPTSRVQLFVLGLAELAFAAIGECVVICIVFKTRPLRAVQVWLTTLMAAVIMFSLGRLVMQPFVYEVFAVPLNAMAPTLVGQHWQGTCPTCGQPNYCSPRDERNTGSDPPLMICENFHVTRASSVAKSVHAGDRFIVAKFLAPRRWDLVVFQYPQSPSKLGVMRLVGLPGETVLIQDGSVWVNGKEQAPPESIHGIEYLSELPGQLGPDEFGLGLWGSVNRPAELGNDEYFVLGDFSAQSHDSRLWEQGAPAHKPFAVPHSHLKGVVTHTYSPAFRWRIHR